MKKILLSALAALMLATPASAQYYGNGRPVPQRHRAGYSGSRYNNYHND